MYMFHHDASRNVYASARSDMNPTEKMANPATLTVLRHHFPTNSVDRTIADVPAMDLPNLHTNLRAAYTHTFGEKAVITTATDMVASDRTSIFLRPR
uniref:Uncharacterized protein n=1 Tax=Oryza meridionalis TaxID=40149 RepID=A0A0E0DVB8_9ORYZ